MKNKQIIRSIIIRIVLCVCFFVIAISACSTTKEFSEIPPQEIQSKVEIDDQSDINSIDSNIVFGTQLRFKHLTINDGLSQSSGLCIVQDRNGYIWIGTEDGLNKFDGYTFTIYKNVPDDPHSISGNWIVTLLEDNQERLWIGTQEAGLSIKAPNSDQFTSYQYDPENPNSISDNEITAIYQDNSGNIWIGTGNGGLSKFNEEDASFTHFQHNPDDDNSISSNAVTGISGDQTGALWIATEDSGLDRFDPATELWSHYTNNPLNRYSLSNDRIRKLYMDSHENLWIGTDGGGLNKYDAENERFIHFQNNPEDPQSISGDIISAIFEDQSNVVWIGTIGNGLNQYNAKTNRFYSYQNSSSDTSSLSNNYVLSVLQDHEGGLWFGTFGGGINKLDAGWTNFPLYQHDDLNSNSLSENMVRALYTESNDKLWIGTLESGVDSFDRPNNIWQHYKNNTEINQSLSDNFVSVIYRDQTGELWIGTASGLDRYNPEADNFSRHQPFPNADPGSLENNIRTILESSTGQFWIGTKGGLFEYNRTINEWEQHYYHNPDDTNSLNENWIFTTLEDKSGNIWIGTVLGGLDVFDPIHKTFTHYLHDDKDPTSINNDFIMAIFQDSANTIWIGTPGGLDKYNSETNSFSHYQEADGLANNTIYCILEDKQGLLWLSTNKGLSRFDPQLETFTNYDVSNGLQSNEFNASACALSSSGEMFFGGIGGFNAFHPDNLQKNETIPQIVITSFYQNGEKIKIDYGETGIPEVTLNRPDNSFEFEYSALSFTQPDKNQYAYYLEGFEKNWKEVGSRRFGEYTNLPGGNYTLHIKGSNNDGVWNDAGIVIQITIIPPFWQTGWFYAILILAFTSLFFGGYRLRINNLKKRSIELEKQVAERTSELLITQANLQQSEMDNAISEERNRLARDLHDSVTQSIYSLTLLAEAGQRMIHGGNYMQAEDNQHRLGEIAQQALQEMRLLVYELRPPVLQTEGLAGALEHRLEAVERRAGINARMNIDLDIILPLGMEEELFHISMEALNNALKHAKASEVSLFIQSDEKSLHLEIKDNGHGFDPELTAGYGGMGISSMTERAEKIGGQLSIQSDTETGTTISVLVPFPIPQGTSTDIHEENK